ncbi:hypothetical protein EMIT0P291_250019 [Pseudomonas sp. IT-P291]
MKGCYWPISASGQGQQTTQCSRSYETEVTQMACQFQLTRLQAYLPISMDTDNRGRQ